MSRELLGEVAIPYMCPTFTVTDPEHLSINEIRLEAFCHTVVFFAGVFQALSTKSRDFINLNISDVSMKKHEHKMYLSRRSVKDMY